MNWREKQGHGFIINIVLLDPISVIHWSKRPLKQEPLGEPSASAGRSEAVKNEYPGWRLNEMNYCFGILTMTYKPLFMGYIWTFISIKYYAALVNSGFFIYRLICAMMICMCLIAVYSVTKRSENEMWMNIHTTFLASILQSSESYRPNSFHFCRYGSLLRPTLGTLSAPFLSSRKLTSEDIWLIVPALCPSS